MLRRRFDGKMIGTLLVIIMSVCLSAYASLRSADAWTLNPSDFRYDMVLYFSIPDQGYEDLERYEIGAFINDECRGLAEKINLPEGEKGLYMRIRSNSTASQEIQFLMRDKQTGKLYQLTPRNGESVLFKSNGVVGMPSEPYLMSVYFSVNVETDGHGTVDFKDDFYPSGTEIKVVAVPDEGYHFDSWSDGNKEASRTVTVTSDLNLTANFAPNSYNVDFKIDGNLITTKTFLYNEKVVTPEPPFKEGFTFAGWEDVPSTMPAQDIVITGSYTVNYYKVTFYIEDKIVASEEIAYGYPIIAPEAEEKVGYTFSGWGEIPEAMPARNLEFKGSYTINSYKLTFVIDEDVVEEKELEYDSKIVAPATPDKEGHKFVGWFNYVPTMPASDLTIYGTYDKNSHLLSFVIDDVIIEEKVVVYGSEITAPEAPEKEGYTFAGWDNVPATMPAKDLVINGFYTVNTYKITFSLDGQIVEEKMMDYGSEITAPDVPEKEGYTFAGWDNVPATMPAKDLVINGKYTINYYRLTFIIDEDVIQGAEIPYGAPIVAPATPDKEGHKFVGWFNYVPTMPASDLTIYGTYDKNSHLLSFVIDDVIIEEKVVVYGSEITAPEAPEKEGYTFAGWDNVPATMPAKDLVINGSYDVNLYRLLVFINEVIYLDEMLPYGSDIVIEEPVVPTNMKFEGWSEEIPAVMPAHDVIIYGEMVEDIPTSVVDTFQKPADTVTIYNLNGIMLYKDVNVNEIKGQLAPGLYIINGKKVIIR